MAPCAVSYTALRPDQQPTAVRAVTHEQFEALPADTVALFIMEKEGGSQASTVTENQVATLRARGFKLMGRLTIPNDGGLSLMGCMEGDHKLHRWKAYSLGFDGVAVTNKSQRCDAFALARITK